MRLAVALIAALVADAATADPQPWMMRGDPNDLPVLFLSSPNCPSDAMIIRNTAEGVLVRSRIKPLSFLISGGRGFPILAIEVACEGTAYRIDIEFLGSRRARRSRPVRAEV